MTRKQREGNIPPQSTRDMREQRAFVEGCDRASQALAHGGLEAVAAVLLGEVARHLEHSGKARASLTVTLEVDLDEKETS